MHLCFVLFICIFSYIQSSSSQDLFDAQWVFLLRWETLMCFFVTVCRGCVWSVREWVNEPALVNLYGVCIGMCCLCVSVCVFGVLNSPATKVMRMLRILSVRTHTQTRTRGGHFRYLFLFSIIKNDFFGIFYQVNLTGSGLFK